MKALDPSTYKVSPVAYRVEGLAWLEGQHARMHLGQWVLVDLIEVAPNVRTMGTHLRSV